MGEIESQQILSFTVLAEDAIKAALSDYRIKQQSQKSDSKAEAQ